MSKLRVKEITFSAIAIALGVILGMFKVIKMPFGGSLTLFSMLIMCLPGFFFGRFTGIIAGVCCGLLNFIIEPYFYFPAQFIVDYILAFGSLGLSGFFANSKNGLIKGYCVGVFFRYVFAVLSGFLFFGEYAWEGWNPLAYSLAYNALYILTEGVVTVIILCIPAVRRIIYSVKEMALDEDESGKVIKTEES